MEENETIETPETIETARETFPQKFRRLLIPLLALFCTVLGGMPCFFDWLSALVDWNFSTSVWIGVAGFLLVLLGVGFAVAGLCLHKKVKTAGIVLSVLAIVNPFALLGCCFGGLYTALAIFGM